MEYRAFKDLTKEERSEIVENIIAGKSVEFLSDLWEGGCQWRLLTTGIVDTDSTYRIKPAKKLDIPWEIIKPEYKWAAMDENGGVVVFEYKPHKCNVSWGVGGGRAMYADFLAVDTTGISWENSLTQRPE